MVSDAKSLVGHLRKTGSIPKERQTMIDVLVIKNLAENSVVPSGVGTRDS